MYKLQTKISYFRYNSIFNIGDLNVTWFVLETEDDNTESGRCFTKDELNEFLKYINSRPHNFPGGKNYFECNEEEDFPFCDSYSIIPSNELNMPKNVILRNSPQLSQSGEIYYCMDIIFTNNQKIDNHDYSLDFDVIGKLE